MTTPDTFPRTNPSQTGRVFQINISPGGVPKAAVQLAELTFMGLVGDNQVNKEVHGGIDRAVTLFGLEIIQALQAEGHPVYPGALGENLTVSGLDWHLIQPGMQLCLGEEIRLEVTRFVAPCSKISAYLTEGNIERVSQKSYPGWSRLAARVIYPGMLRVGDLVKLFQ